MRLRLGSVEHDLTTRALVMGVLDRPPSYFDPGAGVSLAALLQRADALVGDGADLLDVGGARGGPGPPVGEDEELERLVPAVAALRARFDVPLSIDTWRARVLAEACSAGAAAVNDGSGFVDPDLLPTAAGTGAGVIVAHTRLQPDSGDVVGAVRSFLARQVAAATAALAVARGCRIVRTADVRGTRRVVAILEALLAARLVHVVAAGEDDG